MQSWVSITSSSNPGIWNLPKVSISHFAPVSCWRWKYCWRFSILDVGVWTCFSLVSFTFSVLDPSQFWIVSIPFVCDGNFVHFLAETSSLNFFLMFRYLYCIPALFYKSSWFVCDLGSTSYSTRKRWHFALSLLRATFLAGISNTIL